MQTFKIENSVTLFGVQAASFPNGVGQAWQNLYKKLSATSERDFYGILHGTEDSILYKACIMDSFQGEEASLGLETFVLSKGEYTGETVHGFMKRIKKIGETYCTLLVRDDCNEKNGTCVERYVNAKDAVCLIKWSLS